MRVIKLLSIFSSPSTTLPHLHNIPTDKTSFQLARTAIHRRFIRAYLSAGDPHRTQFLDWFLFTHRFIGDVRYRALKIISRPVFNFVCIMDF